MRYNFLTREEINPLENITMFFAKAGTDIIQKMDLAKSKETLDLTVNWLRDGSIAVFFHIKHLCPDDCDVTVAGDKVTITVQREVVDKQLPNCDIRTTKTVEVCYLCSIVGSNRDSLRINEMYIVE